jgi:hypothetical protein
MCCTNLEGRIESVMWEKFKTGTREEIKIQFQDNTAIKISRFINTKEQNTTISVVSL